MKYLAASVLLLCAPGIFAAEKATPELVAFMVRYTSGYLCVPLEGEICDRLDLSPQAEFEVIGTLTDVPSGSTASLPWPGRAPASGYEWRVTVSDGYLDVLRLATSK